MFFHLQIGGNDQLEILWIQNDTTELWIDVSSIYDSNHRINMTRINVRNVIFMVWMSLPLNMIVESTIKCDACKDVSMHRQRR